MTPGLRALASLMVLAGLALAPGRAWGFLLPPVGASGRWMRLARWFVLGLALVAVLGALGARLGLDRIGFLALLWVPVTGAGLIVAARTGGRPGARRPALAGPRHAGVLTLGLALWGLASGGILRPACDAWHHLNRIHLAAETGRILPADQPNDGMLYFQVGLAFESTGVDPLEGWRVLPALLLPVFYWSVYGLAHVLFRHTGLSAGAALAFVGLFEGTHLDPLRELAYPRYMALLPLFLALELSLRHVRRPRRRHLLAGFLLASGSIALHVGELPLYLVALGATAAGLAALGRLRLAGRAAGPLAAGAAAAGLYLGLLAPPGVQRLSTGPTTAGSTRSTDAPLPHMIYLTDRHYVVDPRGEFGSVLGRAGLLACLVSPAVLALSRSAITRAFLAGACLAPLVISFVPPLLVLFLNFYKVVDVYHRVALVAPWPLLLPLIARGACRGRGRERGRTRGPGRGGSSARPAWGILLGVLAVLCWPVLRMRLEGPRQAGMERRDIERLAPLRRTLAWMEEHVPAGGRLLSDPLSSWFAFGLTHHRMADLGSTRSRDRYHLVAGSPARLVLDRPEGSSAELLATLDRLDIDHVLFNRVEGLHHVLEEHHLNHVAATPAAAGLLADNPELFVPVHRDGPVRVYRVRRPFSPDLKVSGRDRPVAPAPAPPPGAPPGATSGEPLVVLGREVALVATDPAPPWRLAGGRVQVPTLWLRVGRWRPPGLVVTLELRHDGYRGPGYHPRWGNLYRFLVQRLTGHTFRIPAEAMVELGDPAAGDLLVPLRIPIGVGPEAPPGTWQTWFRVRSYDEDPPPILHLADAPATWGVRGPDAVVLAGPGPGPR